MTGINIWVMKNETEDKCSCAITLNLNFWNDIKDNKKPLDFLNFWNKILKKRENYLDIGVLCDTKCSDLLITLPMKIEENLFTDLHPIIKENPKLLNLIFSNTKEYSSKQGKNEAFVFSLDVIDDSQLLSLDDHYTIDNSGSATIIHISLLHKKLTNSIKKIYIRFRVKILDSTMFYKKISQQGLQDHISTIECFDIRINDPRNTVNVKNKIEKIIKEINKDRKKHSGSKQYDSRISILKAVHIITVDPFNKHPICYDDSYSLTPRILEPGWQGYLPHKNSDLLTHHFKFKPETPAENSICFAKFEHKQLSLITAICTIFIIGVFTELMATPIMTHIITPIINLFK